MGYNINKFCVAFNEDGERGFIGITNENAEGRFNVEAWTYDIAVRTIADEKTIAIPTNEDGQPKLLIGSGSEVLQVFMDSEAEGTWSVRINGGEPIQGDGTLELNGTYQVTAYENDVPARLRFTKQA